jgi:hypothetical protein
MDNHWQYQNASISAGTDYELNTLDSFLYLQLSATLFTIPELNWPIQNGSYTSMVPCTFKLQILIWKLLMKYVFKYSNTLFNMGITFLHCITDIKYMLGLCTAG